MMDIIPFQTATNRGPAQRNGRILVVARDGRFRDRLIADVSVTGYDVTVATDLTAAGRCLSQDEIDACLVDLDEAGGGLLEFFQLESGWRRPTTLLGVVSLERFASAGPDIPAELEVLPKPCSPDRLKGRLADAVRRQRLNEEYARLRNRSHQRLQDELVGGGEAVETLRREIDAAAHNDQPLLITGEPGSGRTLVARAVHLSSGRCAGPLVSIDCGLRTSACLEEELFGQAAGGLDARVTGGAGSGRLFRAAGGTLVLENVDQATGQLATAVADFFSRQFEYRGDFGPLGLPPERRPSGHWSTQRHAQNRTDLTSAPGGGIRLIAVIGTPSSEQGETRLPDSRLLDLFGQQRIVVPPLRERREDIVPLAEHFLHRLAVREGRPIGRLTADARRLLESADWSGNVRQLGNVVARAASIELDDLLTADALRPWLDEAIKWDAADEGTFAHDMTLKQMERKLIEATFNRYRGNRERTAQALRIGLRTLSGKLREYGYPPRGGPGSNRKVAQRKAA